MKASGFFPDSQSAAEQIDEVTALGGQGEGHVESILMRAMVGAVSGVRSTVSAWLE